jgi:hypothetical protein
VKIDYDARLLAGEKVWLTAFVSKVLPRTDSPSVQHYARTVCIIYTYTNSHVRVLDLRSVCVPLLSHLCSLVGHIIITAHAELIRPLHLLDHWSYLHGLHLLCGTLDWCNLGSGACGRCLLLERSGVLGQVLDIGKEVRLTWNVLAEHFWNLDALRVCQLCCGRSLDTTHVFLLVVLKDTAQRSLSRTQC